MTSRPEGIRKPAGQWDVPESPTLWDRDVALPLGPLHTQLPLVEIDKPDSSAIISPHRSPASPPSSTDKWASGSLAFAAETSRSYSSKSWKRGEGSR